MHLKHGGKREGAGRKPVSEKKKGVTVRLYPSDVDLVKQTTSIQKLIDYAVSEYKKGSIKLD